MLLSERNLPQGIFRGLGNRAWVRYCLPEKLYRFAGLMVPPFAVVALVFAAAGLYLGLFAAPGDTPLGEVYRIAFIHVPASWMSMLIYLAMALCAGVGRVFDAPVAAMTAQALAPTGAMFTFLGIWTGCLWSRPVWGTWWVGDLELYSELILLLFYTGIIALHLAMDDPRRAGRACVPLAFAGLVWVPVNFASVQSWTVEHAGTAPGLANAPGLASVTLAGMLAMSLGFFAYAGAMTLLRLRCVILENERQSDWMARCAEKPL